jgi:Zn-finger nucleic acid-binding protein
MDDYSIVRDEYFYIKEKAFKDLSEIKKSIMPASVKERRGKAQENAEQMQQQRQDENHKQKVIPARRPVSRKLHCPLHATVLKTVYLETIAIDYCPQCYGIWLDFGEMERLFRKTIEKQDVFKDILAADVHRSDSKNIVKKCPVCAHVLEKKKHYYSDLTIDVCRICGGVWLDSGEFAELYLQNKHEDSVQEILAGVLGNYIDIYG